MGLERPIQDAKDAVGEKAREARNLISWLPSPKQCEGCGRYTYADVEYVEAQAMRVRVWVCREGEGGCGARYYRDRE